MPTIYNEDFKRASDFTPKEARELAKLYIVQHMNFSEVAYYAGCSEEVLSRMFFKAVSDAVLDEATSEKLVQSIICSVDAGNAKKRKVLIRWEKALFAREISAKIIKLSFFFKQMDKINIYVKTVEEVEEINKKKASYLAEIENLKKEKQNILGGTKNG